MGIGGFEPPTLGALTAQTTNNRLAAAIRPMLCQAKLYAQIMPKTRNNYINIKFNKAITNH